MYMNEIQNQLKNQIWFNTSNILGSIYTSSEILFPVLIAITMNIKINKNEMLKQTLLYIYQLSKSFQFSLFNYLYIYVVYIIYCYILLLLYILLYIIIYYCYFRNTYFYIQHSKNYKNYDVYNINININSQFITFSFDEIDLLQVNFYNLCLLFHSYIYSI